MWIFKLVSFPFLCFIAYILFSPIIIVITIINEITRILVSITLFLSFGKIISIISHGCSSFFVTEESNKFCICLVKCKILTDYCDIDIERDINLWNERVLSHTRFWKFKRTIIHKFGYACWRDDSQVFNVRNHVKYYNKNESVTEEELYEKILPDVYNDNGDDSKPQWGWFVLPRVEMEDGTAFSVRILRIHHAYGDGANIGNIVGNCLFDWPEKNLYKSSQKMPLILTYTKESRLEQTKFWLLNIFTFILFPAISVYILLKEGIPERFDPTFLTKKSGNPIFGRTYIDRQTLKDYAQRRGLLTMEAVTKLMRPTFYQIWKEKTVQERDGETPEISMALLWAVPPFLRRHPMRNRLSTSLVRIPLSLSTEDETLPEMRFPSVLIALQPVILCSVFGRFPIFFRDFVVRNFPARECALLSYLPCTNLAKAEYDGRVVDEWEGFTPICPPSAIGLLIMGYGGQYAIDVVADDSVFSKKDVKMILTSIKEEAYRSSV